jgi:predicted ATP-grasp superfamily ATP-dependent carboligase
MDGMNGLQTARLLAAKGIPIIGLAKNPRHPCCRTRVCERIVQADIQTDALIESLESLASTLPRKAVLFPCYDMGVLVLSRNRNSIEPLFHHSLPREDTVELAMDKTRLYRFAQERGLPIPRTYFLRERDDAQRAIEEISFPCVLKPPFSADPGWEAVSLKAYKISDAPGLLRLYDRCRHLTDTLILQEWVEGPDSELYSCNCYFSRESHPLATFVARKERQWPPETGMSSMGVECRNDRVLEETVRFFEALGHCGLGYLEVKRNPDTDDYFILEPNVGRPTGRSAIAERGGVDLLFTMYCDALGLSLPQGRVQEYLGVKWVHLRRDLQSALRYRKKGELSIREWIQSLRGPKAFALFSFRDPLPFLVDLLSSAPELIGDDPIDPRDLSRAG